MRENSYLLSLDIAQHNLLEIFTLKRKIASEISKELPNDIFEKFDGNSQMKNIIDRLNLGELQVDDVSTNYGRKYKDIYTNQVNQVLIRCFQ